ncbi:MAG: glycosyltransferase [Candidatus Syntrophonatronum acetioxidans]|uniref:Glycosyltransferase n=1 Tax=Candidatus Syntrophonatronum acetioxidans TaxID=1795816 RepID=A0A424YGT4_9FIRM|nr:MAG: glycosyltransferase [Candidatus Syntrophonatronum acetioxidans]
MERVKTGIKDYQDYLPFMEGKTLREIDILKDKLKDKRIAMVNATEYGGGVAEILHSLVPLFRGLGFPMDWWKMFGEEEFYNITKTFHNRLQGEAGPLKEREIETYLKFIKMNAREMADWDYDFVVIHDPQPAGLIDFRKGGEGTRWIWRCHIDTSQPNKKYWDFLYRFIIKYDASIFTMKEFVKEDAHLRNIHYITPSIDPLSPKNIPMEKKEAQRIVGKFGINVNRPLITQISRFDPWKDPLGVIESYKLVKKEFPSVQLALVGSMASDDPEGWDYLYRTLRRAGEDYDINIITNFNGITSREVNAFQTASDIIIQKSIREGFGLTVTEGLWKGTPVIGGKAGGIKLQIEEGKTGYLVETVEECAQKILILLRNTSLAEEMTRAGKEKVRREFLITRSLLNYLRLFDSLLYNHLS